MNVHPEQLTGSKRQKGAEGGETQDQEPDEGAGLTDAEGRQHVIGLQESRDDLHDDDAQLLLHLHFNGFVVELWAQ